MRAASAASFLTAGVWSLPNRAGAAAAFAPPVAEIVLYRHATLIDGTGGPSRGDMDVLVVGERIEAVFPDTGPHPELDQTAKVVDLSGRFILPGLIDAHVHLATPPNRRKAEAVMRRNLYGGVTTVRDMADDLRAVGDLARASLVGEIAGPDIYYAALMAGPAFFTDQRTAMTTAGYTPGHVPWMQAVDNSSDLPLAVAQSRGTFASAIKLYAALPADLTGRITAEAHRQHMLVWAHATLYPARPSEVVAAGVDVISHACLLVREPESHVPAFGEPRTPVPLAPFSAGDNPALARLFAEMVRRGTVLDATIWTYRTDPSGTATAPRPPLSNCDDVVGGAITGQAYRAGVLIDAGTDDYTDAADPWPDLFHELNAMAVKAHMPIGAVLRSATLIGAQAVGQQRDTGSIEPGKLANMVVLIRDPLISLDNLKSVQLVIKRGRVFSRTAFIPLTEDELSDL
ncbi:MAG: hydrolase [Zymomonas sp.]|nr:MAG: hydrolase [Zymomonas sp.]